MQFWLWCLLLGLIVLLCFLRHCTQPMQLYAPEDLEEEVLHAVIRQLRRQLDWRFILHYCVDREQRYRTLVVLRRWDSTRVGSVYVDRHEWALRRCGQQPLPLDPADPQFLQQLVRLLRRSYREHPRDCVFCGWCRIR